MNYQLKRKYSEVANNADPNMFGPMFEVMKDIDPQRNKKPKRNNENIDPNKPNKPNNPSRPNRPNKPTRPFDPFNPNEDDERVNPFILIFENIMNDENNRNNKSTEPGQPSQSEGNKLNGTMECNNPQCNHKTFEEDPTPPTISCIREIVNINDLIEIGKTFHCKKNMEYHGMNLRLLCNLVTPLTELSHMVGMQSIKTNIVNQILFFLRGYNKSGKCNACVDCAYGLQCAKNKDDMLHTVITGPPGVGKTELGKILAKVYKEMGILSKGHFTQATRKDLVGEYVGHTAPRTQKLIDKCKGGVLFIDEVYALGHKEGRDSFSKEALDTLNQNLSENRDLLCIIAGYEKEIEECIFAQNEGLRRRFTFRYNIEKYSADELMEIFLLKIKLKEWEFDQNKTSELKAFFNKNRNRYPNFGGDMETLFLKCTIAHSRQIPLEKCENLQRDRKLSMDDITRGQTLYMESRSYDKSVNSNEMDKFAIY